MKLVDKVSPVKLINMTLFGALISMVGFALAYCVGMLASYKESFIMGKSTDSRHDTG